MEKILFTADLHGNIAQYNVLFDHALKDKFSAIIIGGDITPKVPELRAPKLQSDFLINELFPIIKSFKEKSDTACDYTYINKINAFEHVGNDHIPKSLCVVEGNIGQQVKLNRVLLK